MMKYKTNEYFLLSSSCRTVKGANRSVIIDYLRKDVHLILNSYYDLTEMLNRKRVSEVVEMLDEESIPAFHSFLDFMLENEFAFLSIEPELFPQVSDQLYDDHVLLKDAIIEVDQSAFDHAIFESTISQIDNLHCPDLQLRLLSFSEPEFPIRVLATIDKTNINFVELHILENELVDQNSLFSLMDECTALSKIFVYNSAETRQVPYRVERPDYYSLLLGTIYYVQTPLNDHACGSISFNSLMFNDINTHRLHQNHNGCLYKKLTIDKYGNIKNCPSMVHTYGHAGTDGIQQAIQLDTFKSYGDIKKDDISICQDCEFRYNCSDCRAFLTDPQDLRSKPLKCGYNPYTNEWADWSTSLLKKYEKV